MAPKKLDDKEFMNIIKDVDANTVVVVHFEANWAQQCQQINDVLEDLAADNNLKNVHFYSIDADKFPTTCKQHNIIAVPTVVCFQRGQEQDRIEGARVAELSKKANKASLCSKPLVEKEKTYVSTSEIKDDKWLQSLISRSPIMLFMKGTPENPRCGFSNQIVSILQCEGATFDYFDILTDNEVREGLKQLSEWPTYPQLYVNGELIGGLDIVKTLKESGTLKEALNLK